MASVTAALRLVKDDIQQHLHESLVEKLCQEVGHVWRERTLGPVVTLWLFVEQVSRPRKRPHPAEFRVSRD